MSVIERTGKSCRTVLAVLAVLVSTYFSSSVVFGNDYFALEDNTWELLAIPADPVGLTLSELFGDQLDVAEYGVTWAVFGYDSHNRIYTAPTVSDTLSAGQGFWIIQATGESIQIPLPASLPQAQTLADIPCIADSDCVKIPLAALSTDVSWNLSSIPLEAPSRPSDFLYVNGQAGFSCSDGCTLQQAIDANQIVGPLWVYDPIAEAYFNGVMPDFIEPGQGFWFGTLEAAANSSPALHVPGASKVCSLFVSPEGDDSNNGRTQFAPLQTMAVAVDLLVAGDTLCLMEGDYPAPLVITDKTGTQSEPITIQPQPGSEGEVRIQDDVGSLITGIEVSNSAHVHIIGLDVQRVLRGIQFNSVTGGSITGNTVTNIEQEGIRVGALSGSSGLAGGPSSDVTIALNTISHTGLRPGQNSEGTTYSDFGEGIYVGTGRYINDDTHDILVDSNIITNTPAESIEIKPYTYNITVSNNIASNAALRYSGAITIAVGPESTRDGNYLVEGNVVYQVQSTEFTIAGIVVGQGNAMIRNNTVWDIDGGRGIRVYTTFVNPDANTITIENNTVWNPDTERSIALHDGEGGFELDEQAIVLTSGNITDDGSAESEPVIIDNFIGPFTGAADNGSGPGSGFTLR